MEEGTMIPFTQKQIKMFLNNDEMKHVDIGKDNGLILFNIGHD